MDVPWSGRDADSRLISTSLSAQSVSPAKTGFGIEMESQLKQGLLELRSEQERLSLLARLFKDGMKRLELAEKIAERARVNGKVSFQ